MQPLARTATPYGPNSFALGPFPHRYFAVPTDRNRGPLYATSASSSRSDLPCRSYRRRTMDLAVIGTAL